MATLDKLPTITRILVPLGRREFDEREFHAMPSFVRFLGEILPGSTTGILGAAESPSAQMDTLLRKWNSGKPMAYSRAFSTLRPTRHGVWEMKTADQGYSAGSIGRRCSLPHSRALQTTTRVKMANRPSTHMTTPAIAWFGFAIGSVLIRRPL